jgi:polyhydroxybutyrate depolymerase
MTADGERRYLLHVPPSYNGVDAVPLVLGIHGMGGYPGWMEAYSQLSARADQPDGGFIVAYPQGLAWSMGVAHFNNWQLPSPEPDDVAFVSQLLDSLESQLCIEAGRVYAAGVSNGAMMSVRLACSLSSRIAAVGLVAGAYYPPQSLSGIETCPDTRPVPVIAFHGTDDPYIPFDGGGPFAARVPIDNDTPDEDVMADWAAHDNCTSDREVSSVNSGVQLVEYDSCDGGAAVRLYIIDGGGHAWPGSPYAPPPDDGSNGINATDLIWQFFQTYSLNGLPLGDTDGDGMPDLYDADNDGDGCPDVAELQTAPGSESSGGRRDPNNPWDYFEPNRNGQHRMDDIFAIIHNYFVDVTDPPSYSTQYDRTYLGPNAWNLGPPDGMIRIDDILAVMAQYYHDCA